MGRHSKWRKLVKKLRRKRIRREFAKKKALIEENEQKKREASPTYQKYCEEQNAAELFREQEELRLRNEREEQWLKTEAEAQKQWRELQAKLATIRQERAKQDERIRQEWKKEQEKIKEAKEMKRRIQEENERKQEVLREKIDEYLLNGGDLPEELNVQTETNPTKEVCPFFQKTGACRFKDMCSRNHIRPGVSKILLFPSFYSHFSMEHSYDNEYGSDLSLEYDEREMYNHFCEFFHDVVSELEKSGRIVQFKVCCNREPHLRGNVYVEYSSIREGIGAFKIFHGRWYGRKQLNVEFCNIPSWKTAICDLRSNCEALKVRSHQLVPNGKCAPVHTICR